jgi:tRNA isopentenyltransferase (miaA)
MEAPRKPLPKPLVVAFVGPTCTGKTALSIDIAEELGTEIIACDSRTVYRYMDVGTAKPSREEQRGIPHHLLDVADPPEIYTAANYKDDAGKVLQELIEKWQTPIVCGGTGLYSRVLLEGMNIPNVAPNNQLRQQLNELADKEGIESLHKILEECDPASFARIMKNDRFRIIRAIEVTKALGLPFSQAATRVEVPYEVMWIFLTVEDRTVLQKRIRERLLQQVKDGVIEETKIVLEKFGKTNSLENAVPYKEYLQYLEGKLSLEEANEEAVKHNQALARRQIMWFRANKEARTFCVDKMTKSEIFAACMKEISLKLALHTHKE